MIIAVIARSKLNLSELCSLNAAADIMAGVLRGWTLSGKTVNWMTDKMDAIAHGGYHRVTRWLHAGLVLGVLFQLTGAALMTHPDHIDSEHNASILNRKAVAAEMKHPEHVDDGSGELFMATHRTGGVMVALIVFANLLWAVIPRGKPRKRQIAVLASAKQWRNALSIAKNIPLIILGKKSLPEPGNPLSLVFEMLGLLIMTAMAITGSTIWILWAGPGNTVSSQAELLMGMHTLIAVMLFLYLAGHISMALMHARAGDPVFERILPLGKSNSHMHRGEKL